MDQLPDVAWLETLPVGQAIFAAVCLSVVIAGLILDRRIVLAWINRSLSLSPVHPAFGRTQWATQDAAVLVLFMFFPLILTAAVAVFGDVPPQTDDVVAANAAYVVQMVTFPLAWLGLLLWTMRVRNLSWSVAFGLQACSLLQAAKKGGVYFLATMPPLMLLNALNRLILSRFEIDMSDQSVVQLIANPHNPVWITSSMIIVATACAPCIEELLFRGVAMPALARRIPLPLAVIVTSLLFACMHLHLPSVVPLFVLSMALSVVYIRSGSIVAPIIMHAMFNAFNISAFYLVGHG